MDRKNEILNKIGYPTIERFLELENNAINDFTLKGVAYLIRHRMNLRPLDSTGLNFYRFLTGESYIKIEKRFEKTSDIKEYVDNGDYERIVLFKEKINVFSSKVIYITIKKIKITFLF